VGAGGIGGKGSLGNNSSMRRFLGHECLFVRLGGSGGAVVGAGGRESLGRNSSMRTSLGHECLFVSFGGSGGGIVGAGGIGGR
jgi:hypothetical protein